MKRKELIAKLIKLTNKGFNSVKLLPKTVKKYSNEAYSCILETVTKKANKPYLDSLDLEDFKQNKLVIRIEFMTGKTKIGIKEISLMKDGEKILVLQGIMNVNIKTLINKTGQELPELILKRLQEQKMNKKGVQ
ncbi:MAG: hypothetical protein ACOC4G_11605 [Bacillota bacterium]